MRPVAHPPTPGWKAETRASFGLAAPLVVANLLQMLTYAVDVIFIARLGPDELAASSLAIALFGLVLLALQNLVGAVAPIMAAELGARAPALRPVRRSMRMALWLSLAFSALGMAVCASIGALMEATGQPPRVAALASEYMDVLVWSLPAMVVASALRNFVATLGRPGFATLVAGLGIFVNVAANYAFVFGNWGAPALGLQGAGIATVLTSLAVLAMYAVAIRLDPRLHRYRITGFFWRPDRERAAEIMRIGTPFAVMTMAEAGVFGASSFLVGRIGALELAAHTLAFNLAAFAWQVPSGISQAATIRVGYFLGARDPLGVTRAGWTSIAMAAGFMLLAAAAMLGAPMPLLSIYLDVDAPANAALLSVAVTLLAVAGAFQLVDGLQGVTAGALRGLKDTRVPMWIAIFSYWVPGFGLAAWLGLATPLGATGVWMGLAAGLTCAAAMLLWRWHRREALGLATRPISPPAG